MGIARSGFGAGFIGLIVLSPIGGFAFGQEREAGSAASDARRVLDEALAQAASAEKAVFLHFGGPGCGWCVRLTALLSREDVSEILARDYVVIEIDIDRMKGAPEVIERYSPGGFSGGIPWYLILDRRGKALITSDGPEGNVGYPIQPRGIDHFLSMIEKTSRRIEPAQIERLRSAIEDEAAKINRESKSQPEVDKPPAKVGDPAPQLKQLEGTWDVISWAYGGKESAQNEQLRLEVKGDRFIWHIGDRDVEERVSAIDLASEPKTIDLTRDREDRPLTNKGIYKIEGDALVLCTKGGRERPNDFKAEEGSRQLLRVLKRSTAK